MNNLKLTAIAGAMLAISAPVRAQQAKMTGFTSADAQTERARKRRRRACVAARRGLAVTRVFEGAAHGRHSGTGADA